MKVLSLSSSARAALPDGSYRAASPAATHGVRITSFQEATHG
ncbi:hypothetical protein QTH97_27310 [Variovorax sp. J22R24]|nr:hypothetical protein [Variovorax sp. J22R24]MDM0108685.1 hypothetical protein [Variovorax sp. J22R24]